jgi:hypothetical protein
MRRWREYFAELLNGPGNEEDEEETLDYYGPEQEIEEPTLLEVDITIGELKIVRCQAKII